MNLLKKFDTIKTMKNLYDINDWKDITVRQKIGEILMQSGYMNLKHLDMALQIQRIEYKPIGEILVDMKIITSDQLNAALDLQNKINARFE